jgi:hypothetical protein
VQRTRGAFGFFEQLSGRITPGPQRTLITSGPHRFNFVGITAQLKGRPVPTATGDGLFAMVDIFYQRGQGLPNGQPLARDVRLVLTAGTAPANFLRGLGNNADGRRIRLVGFPRVNLTIAAQTIATNQPFAGKLPYEMIITWMQGN